MLFYVGTTFVAFVDAQDPGTQGPGNGNYGDGDAKRVCGGWGRGAPRPPPRTQRPPSESPEALKPRSPLAAHACGHANIDIYIFLTRHARNTSELE